MKRAANPCFNKPCSFFHCSQCPFACSVKLQRETWKYTVHCVGNCCFFISQFSSPGFIIMVPWILLTNEFWVLFSLAILLDDESVYFLTELLGGTSVHLHHQGPPGETSLWALFFGHNLMAVRMIADSFKLGWQPTEQMKLLPPVQASSSRPQKTSGSGAVWLLQGYPQGVEIFQLFVWRFSVSWYFSG